MSDTRPTSRSGGDWIADLMSLHIAWQQAMEAHEDEETRFRNGGSSNGACNVALHRSIGKRQALQNLIWECWPQIKAALLAASENRTQEGYPGIAHDFETMRSALVQIRDECFNGHAHDIAEAALNAAPQDSGRVGASQSHDPAVAAPASSERSQFTPCDECDPSFGCFNSSAPCSKAPLSATSAQEPKEERSRGNLPPWTDGIPS